MLSWRVKFLSPVYQAHSPLTVLSRWCQLPTFCLKWRAIATTVSVNKCELFCVKLFFIDSCSYFTISVISYFVCNSKKMKLSLPIWQRHVALCVPNFSTRWSGQPCSPTALSHGEKNPGTHSTGGWVGLPQSQSGWFTAGKFLPIRIWTLGCLAHSLWLYNYTILAACLQVKEDENIFLYFYKFFISIQSM
jgi:hypothetical protein